MFDGILFDLDGTLWDAVPEVTESWNNTLAREGIDRVLTVEELRPCMGLLLSDIGARLLPDVPPARREELIGLCCTDENAYLARYGAALYPGLEATLSTLSKSYPLFIVSNCQEGYIEAFYQGTGLERYFTGFESAGNTGLTKAENIALVVKRHGLKKPVYVGDTALDYASAQAAGVPFILAAYGFGQVDNVPAIRSPGELEGLLETLGA